MAGKKEQLKQFQKSIFHTLKSRKMSKLVIKEEHHASGKQKSSTPSFLIKTYEILGVQKVLNSEKNPDYEAIISWTADGNAFVVRNISELADKVLPNHFKHNNYASFVRQLNMYDFHKIKNESGENEFRHRYFQRGNKNLLSEIKRKQGDQNEQEDDRHHSSELFLAAPSLDFDIGRLKNDYQFFLNEILGIKNKQNELQKAITIIITQNDHLINENKLLWQEIKRIRETDERKIETLSYLLATFINNQGSNNHQPLSIPSLSSNNNMSTIAQGNRDGDYIGNRFQDKNGNSEQSGKSVNAYEDDSLKNKKDEREKPNLSLIEQQIQKKQCIQAPQRPNTTAEQLLLNLFPNQQVNNTSQMLQQMLGLTQLQSQMQIQQPPPQQNQFSQISQLSSLAGAFQQQQNPISNLQGLQLDQPFDNSQNSLFKQFELMQQLQQLSSSQSQNNVLQQVLGQNLFSGNSMPALNLQQQLQRLSQPQRQNNLFGGSVDGSKQE